jgi:acyl-CoA synthetase (NDP forming)
LNIVTIQGRRIESRKMQKQAQQEKLQMLTEVEAKALLQKAGIPVVETKLARTKKEATAISKQMGFPVVLKIVSPDISHKSDVGGVKVGLENVTRVNAAYSEIMASVQQKQPGAKIQGVAVQKMARPGVEVIIGMSQDSQFGPVLMFGLGGVLVEVLKDVSFRLVPVTAIDAAEMIKEIKGYPLLEGYRGQEPVDIPALEKLIVKISVLIEKNPQIKELDLNPVFAYGDGAIAADARIVMG